MPTRLRILSGLLLLGLAGSVTRADSVYLKNGQRFEGVEALISGEHVQIDLPIGSMRLRLSQVERIEETDSTLGSYRERESRLGREPGDARGWLELAIWAHANEFEGGAEKAALMAARLDPQLESLDRLMAGMDYLYDEATREWLPYADAMRRRGLVEDDGEWVTPEEKRERSRGRVATVAEERPVHDDHDHLDQALDILAEAVRKPDAPSSTTVIVQPATVGAGFGLYPGFAPGAFISPAPNEQGVHSVQPFSLSGMFFRGDGRVTGDTSWDQLTRRQPGSFIPATPRFFR